MPVGIKLPMYANVSKTSDRCDSHDAESQIVLVLTALRGQWHRHDAQNSDRPESHSLARLGADPPSGDPREQTTLPLGIEPVTSLGFFLGVSNIPLLVISMLDKRNCQSRRG